MQVEMCRMPALAVLLSLDYAAYENKQKEDKSKLFGLGDVVPFISGLLLGSDAATRTWFSLFIKNGQKVAFFLYFALHTYIYSVSIVAYFSDTKELPRCKHCEKNY